MLCNFCKQPLFPLKINVRHWVLACGYKACKALGPIGVNEQDAIKRYKGFFKLK